MESNFNNRDFEEFVKHNADQYRMFPSEKVWKGIDTALHTRRKWYGLGLALLLLLTGAGVALVMITTPVGSNKQSLTSEASRISGKQSGDVQSTTTQTTTPKSGPINFGETTILKQNFSDKDNDTKIIVNSSGFEKGSAYNNVNSSTSEFGVINSENDKLVTISTSKLEPGLSREHNSRPVVHSEHNSSIALEENQITSIDLQKAGDSNNPSITEKELFPWTIESVVNSFKKKAAKKSITWQLYVAPTVSYRKLSENKGFLQTAALNGFVPTFAAYSDVKNFVIHKPDIGLELGVAGRYPLNNVFTIKAGLQFNVSRYDIKAYRFPGEIATIALNAGSGNSSISTSTVYRARNGNRSNWLQNLYYSASTPVGIEYKLNAHKSTYFGLAATIQPTYVISNRAYLLSTDYKNYVEVPSLTRRWNINTGFEAFVSYKSGKTRWQIGPQVRYQLKSSFIDTYPVKENLFDFGLKVGVLFNNK